MQTTLPVNARYPINRCNLPAVILGSLSFYRQPVALSIDGVRELNWQLFSDLDQEEDSNTRSILFTDYMRSAFLLDNPEEAGRQSSQTKYRREKADYLKLLRGWFFNPDGLEAAVFKGWVESRFGLKTRNHNGPLREDETDLLDRFHHERSLGLYNSNALETQLDLLYSFCQYELTRRYPDQSRLQLFRGTNNINEHETLSSDKTSRVVLMNNLNSFTSDRERADEFGDVIITSKVPFSKILFFPELLSAIPRSESEYLVIGGVYEIKIQR